MDTNGSKYDERFYAFVNANSLSSAAEIVPVVCDLIRPQSVVDVGCGQGAWLAAFGNSGVADIHGYDGTWVDPSHLLIPAGSFEEADLSERVASNRRYDLAVSLEVAEHLPPDAADTFVSTLVAFSDVVLFSAAIPGQGGTDHKNEQWPEYWATKFGSHGYVTVDCLRRRFWANPRVSWWYAQNTMLFVRAAAIANHPNIAALASTGSELPHRLIHPDHYQALVDAVQNYEGRRTSAAVMAGDLASTVVTSVKRRMTALRP